MPMILILLYCTSFGYLYANLCFFAGVVITYMFEHMLHWFEHWIMRKKSQPSGGANDQVVENGAVQELENVVQEKDEDVLIAGSDGEMVAEVYRMNADDAKALTRMGIFAGIALAFHVS